MCGSIRKRLMLVFSGMMIHTTWQQISVKILGLLDYSFARGLYHLQRIEESYEKARENCTKLNQFDLIIL